MGIKDWFTRPERRVHSNLEKRAQPNLENYDAYLDYLMGEGSEDRIFISPANATQIGTVFSCVKVLAESVASLPLILYHRLDRGKERATFHPLYSILHDAPNEEMTAVDFWEAMMYALCLWGNAYAQIIRDNAGNVYSLTPLLPSLMQVSRAPDKSLLYIYRSGSDNLTFSGREILHIRTMSQNGLIGLSPIAQARETFSLAAELSEFSSSFFRNNATPGGVLEHPKALSDEAKKRLEQSWEERHKGPKRAGRVSVLEEGMQYKTIGIPLEDAQFLEIARLTKEDICGIFRLPPYFIGDLSRATFSNVEQLTMNFVVHSLRPWLVRIERAILVKLLAPSERQEYFAEFLVDGLLRGDLLSRFQSYAIARQWGWYSADDILEIENKNPLPNGQGSIYLIPMNMIPATSAGQLPVPQAFSEQFPDAEKRIREARIQRSAAKRLRLSHAFQSLFLDAAARVVRREITDVRAAAKKYLSQRTVPDFQAWLEQFYEDHGEFTKRQMSPAYLAYAEAIEAEIAEELGNEVPGAISAEIEGYIRNTYIPGFITAFIGSSLGQMHEILRAEPPEGKTLFDLIDERLGEWEETKAEKVARREVTKSGNAVARQAYKHAGVKKLVWHTMGSESCPFCQELDGKVVGIEEAFLPAGEFSPEGAESPLVLSSDVYYPPAHDGCVCQVVAA